MTIFESQTAVETILVVDDHAAVRALLCDLLVAPERSFVEGCDGNEAIALYRKHQPEWVIMDIEMPGLDGLAASRAICKSDPAARIVIITQHDDPFLRTAAVETGALAFLSKDHLFELPQLLSKI